MNRTFSVILVLLCLTAAFCLFGCERDDLCAETTATTPRLIIRFYDINNQDEFKQVRQLEVDGLDDMGMPAGTIISRTNTDSIAIPLRFSEENTITTTRFQFERDADFGDNENPDNDSNIDIVEVTYTPQFIYVSRACGFRSIFDIGTTGSFTREDDSDNWVINTDILNTTIDNEAAAHVIIYH